ncbi:DoxX family protein [Microlunatus soli]|uniref:DoxX-like family protein n=1 Tax=Microlunatus soli TaxID=630515 RepID=A0A1H1SST4_9ACTN|nr:DoxX family protein [Microlunatus soli]SDS50786.1 DoxX-like family protein [Microlunatus soli]
MSQTTTPAAGTVRVDQVTTSDQDSTSSRYSTKQRVATVVVFVLRLALALIFLQAAFSKLTLNEQARAGFATLGGDPMLIFVGLLELAGAIGLMVPILSGFASIGLSALLVIITVVTAVMMPAMLAMPVGCLVLALALVYLRRRQTVRLARFVRRVATRS